MEKYIAAVDLGTKRISVLAGKKTVSGKFHVFAHHEAPSRGVVQGEVWNSIEAGNVLKTLIDEMKQQEGVDITEVYAGVSGEHIQCIKQPSETSRDKPNMHISEEEIRRLEQDMYGISTGSNSEVRDVIPQGYQLDDKLRVPNPVGACGHRLKAEFCVLTAAKPPMQLIRRSIEHAGLQVKNLFLSPLAAAEAVLSDDDKEMGVAVVDIGGGTTSVVIYCDNIIRHVDVIPFGGDVITDDIRSGCAISARYADQLKVQYGSCYSELIKANKTVRILGAGGGEVSFRMLAKIIEARMDEIMETVVYIIQQSGYAGRLNAGIVLTGGGAKIGDLTEFVKYKTGMKARKGELLFVTSDSVTDVQHCDCATAVGLLMMGSTDKKHVPIEPEIFESVIENAPVKSGSKKKVKRPEPPEHPEPSRPPRVRRNPFSGVQDMFKEFFKTDNEV
ncbi:MAG: cell division protein FtsA [Prevotellaceae bacterium]|jgi:cell division protein FtsA|nr:cell division protein FtsA [Prevotellaceae bacterium]